MQSKQTDFSSNQRSVGGGGWVLYVVPEVARKDHSSGRDAKRVINGANTSAPSFSQQRAGSAKRDRLPIKTEGRFIKAHG